jgi:two-component system chemotaxis response regulator CheY
LALLKACRANQKLKSVPFIIVTVESEKQFVMKAIEEGVSDFVIKPFNAQTLKEKIQRVYQRLSS